MHPRLSVHTVGFGNRSAVEIFRLLAAAGLCRAGVTLGQLELGGIARSIEAAREANVRVVDIAAPAAFDLQAPSTWAASQSRLRACADAAAGIGRYPDRPAAQVAAGSGLLRADRTGTAWPADRGRRRG